MKVKVERVTRAPEGTFKSTWGAGAKNPKTGLRKDNTLLHWASTEQHSSKRADKNAFPSGLPGNKNHPLRLTRKSVLTSRQPSDAVVFPTWAAHWLALSHGVASPNP